MIKKIIVIIYMMDCVKGVQALDKHYTCEMRNKLLTLQEINILFSS